jgi:hypothetical protein
MLGMATLDVPIASLKAEMAGYHDEYATAASATSEGPNS